ncbi:epithelial membrane protein 2-like [Hydractinia symbiolongicarpus]|uniref:epithelial membrane protein 2-like n=1 Tax=Hydractinia symbiolongicarpus TaxID=13093 RepID=UPI00254B0319|nr:epithelial membrane protein 2-like [Hydractinia symbiolongicarpus]
MALSSVIRHINFAITVFAALFTVLSTAGNYWQYGDDFHLGLWKTCSDSDCIRHDIETFRATQILMVLCCICFGFVAGYVILMHLMKNLSPKFMGVILLITCLFEIAALSFYTDKMGSELLSYGWAYALGWVASILSLISGVVCVLDEAE